MISQLAISGYRSLRDVTLPLGPLTIVTGANGAGKSSVYRALRLLADVARGQLIGSLAREGGLTSTLWAGPERISREMRAGVVPVQGTVRRQPITLRMGFSGDDMGYAIDLGLPQDGGVFAFDPEIKVETMWLGGPLRPSRIFAERRGPMVRLRQTTTGEWRASLHDMRPFDSMVTHAADRDDGVELLLLRDRVRDWRFYDHLRTDPGAPARQRQVPTYTPVMADDGADLAAAIHTIDAMGDAAAFHRAIGDAFPGGSVSGGTDGVVEMRQHGLLRPLGAAELSDGTLRYIMLCAALLSPRRPELLILNEPETSLHPSLIAPLARLLLQAATECQIVAVTHSDALIDALGEDMSARTVRLVKDCGETFVHTDDDDEAVNWVWPKR